MINMDDLTTRYSLKNPEELSICGDNADVCGLSALENLKKLRSCTYYLCTAPCAPELYAGS